MMRAGDTIGKAEDSAARSVGEAFGQIAWLLGQSPLHRELPIKTLERSFVPPIIKEQFRMFRFGPLPGGDAPEALQAVGLGKEQVEQLPLGVAIWAHLSDEAEAKLDRREPLELDDWNSGDRTWVVELISPFATPQNRLTEIMLADLAAGPFAERPFKLHRTDASGMREVLTVDQHLAAKTRD